MQTIALMNETRTTALCVLIGLVGFLVYYFSPKVVEYCRRMGLVSQVTARSSHTVPTPHGGGLILPLVVVPVGLLMSWLWPLPFKGYLTVLLLGSLVVAYVSWLDDRHELSPKLRLIIHFLAVTVTLFLLPPLFDFLPLGLEKILLMVGWAWFINLYNFMDGADGLATSEAIALSLGLALLVPAFAPLALMIAIACTGFLRVNGPPARVFMGDVGATWLGFILAGLFLIAVVDDTINVIWPLATLPLVFAVDATSTLIRRIWQGHAPWQPHKTFWFHRYMALGHTHSQLVGHVALVNVILLSISILAYAYHCPWLAFLSGMLAMGLIAWYIRRREKRGYTHDSKHRSKS
ncbi:MAG: hypothetical protein DI585_04195 [Pseudomonas fluorescens]|nr:MAG: hypothetical protein DI585_04195 [Pseudomonas fluorescens]